MPNNARDVAALAPNAQSYADNMDGTISDLVTGLVWEQVASTTTYTFPDATKHCADLDLGGARDWRVPSVIELISIADPDNPASNPFHVETGNAFWSSTVQAFSTTTNWYVAFIAAATGVTSGIEQSKAMLVRCVR